MRRPFEVRILFSSHVFAPSVGGIETVSALLAEEFVRQGHDVRLITQTAGDSDLDRRLTIHRKPSVVQQFALARWCEVFFHNNISLPRAWPLLFLRRPWVVANHVWIPQDGLAAKAKRRAMLHATCISASAAIGRDMPAPSTVIPNPYDDSLFRVLPGVERTRDLVFLGRLVQDKGADLLVTALAKLARRGLRPSVTIIGSGPEEAALRAQVSASGLQASVTFVGARRGPELLALLNQHRFLVIPSRWQEPFGVVALEGIAAGCVVVASNGGGLPEAVGPCGETFPNGDSDALASVLARLLRDPASYEALRQGADRHLRKHTRAQVAAEYLRVITSARPTPAALVPPHSQTQDAPRV